MAIISENNDSLRQATTLKNEAEKVGLGLNASKSKVVRIGGIDMNADVDIEASQLEARD